jgi:hypothetical protein
MVACGSVRAAAPAAVCPASTSNSYFFPSGTFRGRIDEMTRTWYSGQLSAMAEPSLSCGDSVESYRFTWLRTFHNPVAVRVWRTAETYELQAIVLNGAGGYDPGEVSQQINRRLTAAEWTRVKHVLDEIGFWGLSTSNDVMGFDGAQWIIEGRDRRYHVVERWGGNERVQDAGLIFLDLAGLSDIKPLY